MPVASDGTGLGRRGRSGGKGDGSSPAAGDPSPGSTWRGIVQLIMPAEAPWPGAYETMSAGTWPKARSWRKLHRRGLV